MQNRQPQPTKTRAERRQAAIAQVADALYQQRLRQGRSGSALEDWAKAENIVRSPIRHALFKQTGPLWANAQSGGSPSKTGEVSRVTISSGLSALALLLLPLTLFWIGKTYTQQQAYQASERLQQEAVQAYLEQMSAMVLAAEGDLGAADNQRLRTVATAATQAILLNPHLSGARKGQVIEFLGHLDLLQGGTAEGDSMPVVDLFRANLRGAVLTNAYLEGSQFKGTYLYEGDLRGANLQQANLRGSDLNSANLIAANLREANLSLVNFSFANLRSANLSGADLSFANLSFANLAGAHLDGATLHNLVLCQTVLPMGIPLDPNRDCAALGIEIPQ